jgi:hypothetical protein
VVIDVRFILKGGQVQVKKEYYKPYLAATEPMFLKPREVEAWSTELGGKGTWVYVEKQYYFP